MASVEEYLIQSKLHTLVKKRNEINGVNEPMTDKSDPMIIIIIKLLGEGEKWFKTHQVLRNVIL